MSKGQAQGLEFRRRHLAVVDQFAGLQTTQPGLEVRACDQGAGRGAGLEIGDGLDVDVEHVQEQPAGRTVGTAPLRLLGEQRMQRIDPDQRGAGSGGIGDDGLQVGEVADSPIEPGTQAVELQGRPPRPALTTQHLGPVASGRGDDELRRRGSILPGAGRSQFETVIADAQGRQWQLPALEAGAGDGPLGAQRQGRGRKVPVCRSPLSKVSDQRHSACEDVAGSVSSTAACSTSARNTFTGGSGRRQSRVSRSSARASRSPTSTSPRAASSFSRVASLVARCSPR